MDLTKWYNLKAKYKLIRRDEGIISAKMIAFLFYTFISTFRSILQVLEVLLNLILMKKYN